jgi:hypothetical protein
MSVEPRGPAVCNGSNNKEGKGEMTKTPISLQDLRRSLYVKAKAEPTWRFWGLIRPISARYSGGLSLRASERILVNRLESRSRQFLEGPSGIDRRNISIAC